MKRTRIISGIAVLALAGLGDAAYLAEAALTGGSLACSIDGLSKCNLVAQSPYAHVLGIPLGVYGLVFYGLFLVAALAAAMRPGKGMERILAALAVAGILASAWFLYIQVALIQAVCIYCLGSAAIAVLLALAVWHLFGHEAKLVSTPPSA